jgi:hypothetical protein
LSCVKFILGKKEEAVRLCEQSVEKHPLSEDALVNGDRVKWLAYAYIYAGDDERALQSFAKLVQIPFGEYYGVLKCEPVFDELRTDPRFDEILEIATAVSAIVVEGASTPCALTGEPKGRLL